jgi:hypothetical protein
MTPILLQSEFRIKSYDYFIPNRSMLKSDPVERQLERALERTVLLLTRSNGNWNGHWNDVSVAHPVERPLERALERTSLLLTRSNGHWNGNWNGWFCFSPGRTENSPFERKTSEMTFLKFSMCFLFILLTINYLFTLGYQFLLVIYIVKLIKSSNHISGITRMAVSNFAGKNKLVYEDIRNLI